MENNNTAILVENISKQYRLGEVGTGTLSHDFNRWWHKIRGKDDPFLKVGETNDRSTKSENPYVWALKDINFEVQKGEVLGIIGKNGAGKSTLLKLLSRVTSPTTGTIKARGRIASLLEVGTGFHPEMTGRENIYMNGTIMGMSRHEIKAKLDEISTFAGIDRYLDTPVKRYSSGMTVRLGFAIAAHLEPEILIVDEVLAVGDAEFQKKAIGKMKDVSKDEGRTVLFVSHNMAAIKNLCPQVILMNDGQIEFQGETNQGIKKYLRLGENTSNSKYVLQDVCDSSSIKEITVMNSDLFQTHSFLVNENILLRFKINISDLDLNATLSFRVVDKEERKIFTSEIKISSYIKVAGVHIFQVTLPKLFLTPNQYYIIVALHIINQKILSRLIAPVTFQIEETGSSLNQYQGKDFGCVFANCDWNYIELENK